MAASRVARACAAAGLAEVAKLDGVLGKHHRLSAVRAHLHEKAGDLEAAIEAFLAAAKGTSNTAERNYLLAQAARLRR